MTQNSHREKASEQRTEGRVCVRITQRRPVWLELEGKWRWETRLQDKSGPFVSFDHHSMDLGRHLVDGRKVDEEAPKDSTAKQSTGI